MMKWILVIVAGFLFGCNSKDLKSISGPESKDSDTTKYDSLRFLFNVNISFPDRKLNPDTESGFTDWTVLEMRNKKSIDTFFTPILSRKSIDSLLPAYVIGGSCARFLKIVGKDLEPLLTRCFLVQKVSQVQQLIDSAKSYSAYCSMSPWDCRRSFTFEKKHSIVDFIKVFRILIPDSINYNGCGYTFFECSAYFGSNGKDSYVKGIHITFGLNFQDHGTCNNDLLGLDGYQEKGTMSQTTNGFSFAPDSCTSIRDPMSEPWLRKSYKCDDHFSISKMTDSIDIPFQTEKISVIRVQQLRFHHHP